MRRAAGSQKEELSAAFPHLDSEAKQLPDAARVPDKPRRIGRRGLNNDDLHFLTGTVELEAATITSTNATPNVTSVWRLSCHRPTERYNSDQALLFSEGSSELRQA